MFNKSKQKNTFGIIGLGRFGMALAYDLAKAGEDILVIDKDEDKVRTMREYTESAFMKFAKSSDTCISCSHVFSSAATRLPT